MTFATSLSGSGNDATAAHTNTYGKLHPTLQQFDSEHDVIAYCKNDVDPESISTWFDGSDRPAFHTPPKMIDELSPRESYPHLTYRQLHEHMNKCPAWPSLTVSNQNTALVVGVLLPSDLMTEVAVVHLCIMSGGNGGRGCCSAPLDPRSSRDSLLRAMDQMKCQGLVTNQEMVEKFDLGFLFDESSTKMNDMIVGGSNSLEQSVMACIADVRIVESTFNEEGKRDGSISWKILIHQEECDALSHENYYDDDDTGAAKVSSSINADPSNPPLLLLRTSGTTATPKLVPLTGPQLYHNACCQIKAMDLSSNDITLNAMPLFHIGGMSCSFFSVLVSGGSAIYSGRFDATRFVHQICGWQDFDDSKKTTLVKPTWYNAVPTMHQAILFRVKSSTPLAKYIKSHSALRFVRSGAANLSWDVASNLEDVFATTVINSFALSECMPVCVQPMESTSKVDRSLASGPAVGVPVGPSLRIADADTGEALAYGEEGEICISGPGVISAYLNAPPSKTHTPDGWLRTGDIGQIDVQSHQVRITGRAKEMIKKGGEQVWPTTVDGVVQAVEGVKICVTFGVKNEIWGEEVAAAVVLEDQMDEATMREVILNACKLELEENGIPSQILFVLEIDLPKTSSGKYLRSKMADIMHVQAVDTGALKAIQWQQEQEYSAPLPETDAKIDRVQAHSSLNGIRIIASIFVVMNHVGFYPTSFLEKMARFNISIPIFFILAAFQLGLSVVGDIKWSTFVGTRIGNLHSLFIITQLIALPSLLIFKCAGDSTGSCDARFYATEVTTWFFSSLTGMFGTYNTANPPSWFLTTIYQFMVIFPFLHKWARTRREVAQSTMLFVFVVLSTFVSVAIFFGKTPDSQVNRIRWSLLAFLPTLFASMLCAYSFSRSHQKMQRRSASEMKKAARVWAVITDGTSTILLVICVLVSLSDCVWLPQSTVSVMRPGDIVSASAVSVWSRAPPSLSFERRQGYVQLTENTLVQVCQVTYDEFVTHMHDSPLTPTNGRFPTTLGLYIGRLRMGTPLAMLWIYGLAQGHGVTAKLMSLQPLLWISPFTYHLYLLHVPVARFYWLVTRKDSLSIRQFWYPSTPSYPIPIMWWEVIVLICICLILGVAIEQFITPVLQPHTVRWGNWICEKISVFFQPAESSTDESRFEKHNVSSTEDLIKDKVKGLTGASSVTRDTKLSDLGLDSLGTTALLSIIRSATPLAEKLTVEALVELETFGELVDFIVGGTDVLSVSTGVKVSAGDEELGLSSYMVDSQQPCRKKSL